MSGMMNPGTPRRDYQPDVYVVIGTTLPLATLALCLRMTARRITRVNLWWDDYFCFLSYACNIVFTYMLLRWNGVGLGRLFQDNPLPADQVIRYTLFYLYFVELFYAASIGFTKCAILSFYWRMFKTSPIRIPIIVLFICSVLWITLRTFIATFHCVPVQAFWDKSIKDAVCNINDSQFFIGTVAAHLAIDFGILALPVFQVGKLQLKRSQRWGVTGLFMAGILVCMASVVIIVYSALFSPASSEIPHDVVNIMIWAVAEVNLAMISACLPMFRPLFMRCSGAGRKGPSGRIGAGGSSGFTGSSSKGGSKGEYQSSRPRSFIKLENMPSKGSKGGSDDGDNGSDSDVPLSYPKAAAARNNSYGTPSHPGYSGPRQQVTITVQQPGENDVDLERQDHAADRHNNNNGILVKSETSIRSVKR